MSCAIWLKNFGLYPIIIEKSKQLGGLQNINPFHNRWYLGVPGKTGKELAQECCRHIEIELIPRHLASKLKRIMRQENNFKICTEEHEITAQSIVIATGLRFKRDETLESMAARHQLSKRVCFNPGVIPINYGQVVAVVGAALMLADTAKHVHLFVRSQLRGFKLNQKSIFEYIEAGKITLHKPATIHKFERLGEKISITFKEGNNSEQVLLLDYLYFRMGFTPNTEEIVQLFDEGGVGDMELNSAGYIVTVRFMQQPLTVQLQREAWKRTCNQSEVL